MSILTYILQFYCLVTVTTLIVSAFGWSFGIIHGYVRFLDALFEFGRQKIQQVEIQRSEDEEDEEDEEDDVDNKGTEKKTDNTSKIEFNSPPTNASNTPNVSPSKRKSNIISQSLHKNNNHQRNNINAHQLPEPPVFLLGEHDNGECQQHEFTIPEACTLVSKGFAAIVDDQVTKCFNTEELSSWNLLTRNSRRNYQFHSIRLAVSWSVGFLLRYVVFMPLRIIFTFTGMIILQISTVIVGCFPEPIRSKIYWHVSLMCFRMLSCGITATLKFHNREYRAKCGDICVANHTSPIDVVVLACDNCYALVGQRHGGFLGILEGALSRAASHVWFERSEMRDRQLVVNRIKEHVDDKNKLPILIFPEGTCINNSAVMMFKKGSFEASNKVCPVAIKYDSRFGDPFWNSSKQGYMHYLFLMMSSWAIKCDVWYLPPMYRLNDETSAEFASRVKSKIAHQGGLVDLAWDGQLKRTLAKTEWREKQQEDFARRLKID